MPNKQKEQNKIGKRHKQNSPQNWLKKVGVDSQFEGNGGMWT